MQDGKYCAFRGATLIPWLLLLVTNAVCGWWHVRLSQNSSTYLSQLPSFSLRLTLWYLEPWYIAGIVVVLPRYGSDHCCHLTSLPKWLYTSSFHWLFNSDMVSPLNSEAWATVASLWSPTSLSILTSEPEHQVILHTANWIFSVFGWPSCQPKHDCAGASVKTSVHVWNTQTSLSASNNNATFKVPRNPFLSNSGEIKCHPFALSLSYT